jgi:AraC-like DNA-binding protein
MADEHNVRAHAEGECSRHVVTACRYIDAHYGEAISLTFLAGVVGCSRRYLAERFRRETGETVHGYLTRVRLNHAVGDEEVIEVL